MKEKISIYQSTSMLGLGFVMLSVLPMAGLYLYYHNHYIIGTILFIFSIPFFLLYIRMLFDSKKVQLEISVDGIYIFKEGFFEWATIKNERITRDPYIGRGSRSSYLEFDSGKKTIKEQLDLLEMSISDIDSNIKAYRELNKKKSQLNFKKDN